MVVVRTTGCLFDHQIRYPHWEATSEQLRHWLETLNLGGVILLGGSAAELALKVRQLQALSAIPLLIAADIEEGVGQRFSGATVLPPPMALSAIARRDHSLAQRYARQMGEITAREAVAVGINWILAPVVDVNHNPDNPVINVRAFGETPELVTELAAAFIDGTRSFPILTCAKHFPGHGDTARDSHLDLPLLPHTRDRLHQTELPPFQGAIAAGVDSVMTAHLLIPAWDESLPATLSPRIIAEELRKSLGFNGLIVTDALIMGGVARHFSPDEIAVKAVEAGVDILLMPENPENAIGAIYRAVREGEISERRIAESLDRIWQAKQKIIAAAGDCASLPDRLTQNLASPEAQSLALQILCDSLVTGGSPPLPRIESGRNLIIADDLLNAPCDRASPAVTYPQAWGYHLQLGDVRCLQALNPEESPTLLQVFIRGNPFRGRAGLSEQAEGDYRRWLASGKVWGLAIYGSPYVRDWFVRQLTELNLDLPWVFSYGQMPSAQRLACDFLCPSQSGNPRGDRFEN